MDDFEVENIRKLKEWEEKGREAFDCIFASVLIIFSDPIQRGTCPVSTQCFLYKSGRKSFILEKGSLFKIVNGEKWKVVKRSEAADVIRDVHVYVTVHGGRDKVIFVSKLFLSQILCTKPC